MNRYRWSFDGHNRFLSMMYDNISDKVLALFCDYSEAERIRYLCSFRHKCYVPQTIDIHVQCYDMLEHIDIKNMNGDHDINSDGMRWLSDDWHIVKGMCFPPFLGKCRLITYMTDMSENSAYEIAKNNCIQTYMNTIRNIKFGKLLAPRIYRCFIVFNNHKEFDDVHEAKESFLLDTISLNFPDTLFRDIDICTTDKAYTDLLSDNSKANLAVYIDSEYDTFDPIFCISRRFARDMFDFIINQAKSAGYEVFILPFDDATIWNWVNYGELSLVDNVDYGKLGWSFGI